MTSAPSVVSWRGGDFLPTIVPRLPSGAPTSWQASTSGRAATGRRGRARRIQGQPARRARSSRPPRARSAARRRRSGRSASRSDERRGSARRPGPSRRETRRALAPRSAASRRSSAGWVGSALHMASGPPHRRGRLRELCGPPARRPLIPDQPTLEGAVASQALWGLWEPLTPKDPPPPWCGSFAALRMTWGALGGRQAALATAAECSGGPLGCRLYRAPRRL